LAPASRRGLRIALNNIAGIVSNGQSDADGLDWASLRYEDTLAIRTALAEKYSVRTANYGVAALRGVLKECWRLGLMTHDEYARAIDLAQVHGDDTAPGRVLSLDELVALFNACQADPSPAGVRDAAIISVMWGTAVRRAELVSLELADYTDGVLTVRGKGNRLRLAYVVGEARRMMERWLEVRGKAEGGGVCAHNKGWAVGDKIDQCGILARHSLEPCPGSKHPRIQPP
jgi:site-specific recombinase XerD